MALSTWLRRRGRSDAPEPEPAATTAPAPEPTPPDVDALLAEADRIVAAEGALAAVERLRQANRTLDDPRVHARVVRLRHEAFTELPEPHGREVWPPRVEDRFPGVDGCPEVTVDQLDADLLASAVTNHGCLLVRGLVTPDMAGRLVQTIDTAFRAADDPQAGVAAADGWPGSWYRPFQPLPEYPGPKAGHRGWVRSAGGVLAADSPPAFEIMVSAFEQAGLREVIGGYLGERPVLSVDKCTLRRVPLDLGHAEWHQDGSFLGSGIRTLNVWLALTPCGGDLPSPGLDLVPRRLDAIVPTGTEGAWFDWSVSPLVVEEVSADAPVIRPEFAAGDALLFDDLFLHRTALPPGLTEERYAIESWFFAESTYPGGSVPILF